MEPRLTIAILEIRDRPRILSAAKQDESE